jgi:hypothetical protein
MRKAIVIIGILVATLACSGKKTNQLPAGESPVKRCYQYIANNDTVYLSLEVANTTVSGSLSYRLYEKDKSQGTLVGEMKGDTILADYTFFAEGTTSVSEVIFLQKNNQLVQGFGESTNANGKQVFKNRSTVDFSGSLVLTEIECKKINE